MSVIDFLAARRRNNEPAAEAATGTMGLKSRQSTQPLTASQFTRHVTHIVEDEMRRSLKKHVDVIDPREMIDLAKMMAESKAKYIAMTLTTASNRTPMTDAETEQLRATRVRMQELESAYNEVNEAIGAQLVDVRGITKE